jgi:hypothetical protein
LTVRAASSSNQLAVEISMAVAPGDQQARIVTPAVVTPCSRTGRSASDTGAGAGTSVRSRFSSAGVPMAARRAGSVA